jgi:hypothetical protein
MTKAEDIKFVGSIKKEVNSFYLSILRLGVGGRFHAFVEWCGVMAEHLNIVEDALMDDHDAFHMNKHTGSPIPVRDFRLSYLSEKIECIFDGRITVAAQMEGNQPVPTQETYLKERDLKAIPKRQQTQRALDDQLSDLREIANRLGMYDAADHLGYVLSKDR